MHAPHAPLQLVLSNVAVDSPFNNATVRIFTAATCVLFDLAALVVRAFDIRAHAPTTRTFWNQIIYSMLTFAFLYVDLSTLAHQKDFRISRWEASFRRS